MIFFAATAKAVEATSQNDSLSALRDYLQSIDTGAKLARSPDQDLKNVDQNQTADAAYAALRTFADRIGVDEPASTADLPKLVEADNLLDFLRGLNCPAQSSAPSKEPPKGNGPVAGGTKPSTPVAATYVGAQVCSTCHANQVESFGRTLMGKIGKTQKGKFDCENCHGPGSAHVKAGGGRGVGGIISFRPEDLSRTAEENNSICLGCHEKGNRTNWHGSTHDERGLMCSNCHTVMKNVSRKAQLKTAFQPDTCFQCHKNKRAEMWRSSHIPVREGKVTCTDCHNPHGSYSETFEDGDRQRSLLAVSCRKTRTVPVGASAGDRKLPELSRSARLQERLPVEDFAAAPVHECHAFGHGTTGGPLQVQSISRSCQNCHTQVHGTNSPAGPLLHR